MGKSGFSVQTKKGASNQNFEKETGGPRKTQEQTALDSSELLFAHHQREMSTIVPSASPPLESHPNSNLEAECDADSSLDADTDSDPDSDWEPSCLSETEESARPDDQRAAANAKEELHWSARHLRARAALQRKQAEFARIMAESTDSETSEAEMERHRLDDLEEQEIFQRLEEMEKLDPISNFVVSEAGDSDESPAADVDDPALAEFVDSMDEMPSRHGRRFQKRPAFCDKRQSHKFRKRSVSQMLDPEDEPEVARPRSAKASIQQARMDIARALCDEMKLPWKEAVAQEHFWPEVRRRVKKAP